MGHFSNVRPPATDQPITSCLTSAPARPAAGAASLRGRRSLQFAEPSFATGEVVLRDRIGRERSGGLIGLLQNRLEALELAADAAADLVAELEHAGIADRVTRVVALLGAADHARGMQDPEVL